MRSDRSEPVWGKMTWMGISNGTKSLEAWEALESRERGW